MTACPSRLGDQPQEIRYAFGTVRLVECVVCDLSVAVYGDGPYVPELDAFLIHTHQPTRSAA
jgi:hypothetical protein